MAECSIDLEMSLILKMGLDLFLISSYALNLDVINQLMFKKAHKFYPMYFVEIVF